MERLTKKELINGYVICEHKKSECNDSCMYGRCEWNKKALLRLKEYEDTGLTPNVIQNYKAFEKDILTLKDILKGMTCETCRNHGKCVIEDNFNIKYCSDWEKGD